MRKGHGTNRSLKGKMKTDWMRILKKVVSEPRASKQAMKIFLENLVELVFLFFVKTWMRRNCGLVKNIFDWVIRMKPRYICDVERFRNFNNFFLIKRTLFETGDL